MAGRRVISMTPPITTFFGFQWDCFGLQSDLQLQSQLFIHDLIYTYVHVQLPLRLLYISRIGIVQNLRDLLTVDNAFYLATPATLFCLLGSKRSQW